MTKRAIEVEYVLLVVLLVLMSVGISVYGMDAHSNPASMTSNNNLGGMAIVTSEEQVEVVEKIRTPNCDWINLDNEIYNELKSLDAKIACRIEGFKSCLMTNSVKSSKYYSSQDGSCNEMQFKEVTNDFGSCEDSIKTIAYPCTTQLDNLGEPMRGDILESEYITVYCCK